MFPRIYYGLMLTNDDLKAIRKVVREEIEAESENFDNDFGHDLKMMRIEMSNWFNKISDRIKDLKIKIKNN